MRVPRLRRAGIRQLKTKLFTDETNMPLEIILKVAAQKGMKILFNVEIILAYEFHVNT